MTTARPTDQPAPPANPAFSLLDRQPGSEKRTTESFRKAIFAQKGKTTLAATEALLTEVEKHRHSPTALAAILKELEIDHDDVYDPALGFIRHVVEHHLIRESPQSIAGNSPTFSQMKNLLREWAGQDPGAALEAAFQFPVENQRPELLNIAFTFAAHSDPALAYERWSAIEDADLRHRLSPQIAWAVAANHPEGHEKWLSTFPTESETVLKSAFTAWGMKAPLKAMEATTVLTKPKIAIDAVLTSWMEKDPEQAMSWATSQGHALPGDALIALAKKDPETAMTHSQNPPSLKEGREQAAWGSRTHYVETIARRWFANDPEEAFTWMSEHLEKEEKGATFRKLLSTGSDAPSSIDLKIASYVASDPHPHAETAVRGFLKNNGASNQGRNWLEQQPETVQRRFMPDLFAQWVSEEGREAGEYLKNLPTPRAQAALVRDALSQLTPEKSAPLLSWAQRELPAEAEAFLMQSLEPEEAK